MGITPTCKVYDSNAEESPKHCLLECPMAQRAWKAYKRIWDEWQAPHDIAITWPFALLGEATTEHEDDPPGLLAYHTGGFTYPRQPLDILHSFIFYHLWSERSTTYGRRDAGDTLEISIPSRRFLLRPGWPPLRLVWPFGRPLDPNDPPRTLLFKLALS
jgi:hypothetical protein